MTDTGRGGDPFIGIRYRTIQATGQLWSLPTRAYFLELAAGTHPQAAWIYDSFSTPQNLITVLNATAEAKSEKWPPLDVTVPIERGVWVSYSHCPVGLTGPITLGFLP